ncbi:MAG: aminopeptidase P family protein, partial [Erysipelotrichaceae bacterium]|nr:aminopeptidase P family protein [Erysipelotrichaceae bacterium]
MNLYSKRREKVFRSLSDNSLAVLFSGKAPMCSADEAYPFVVDRNFYYLTGLEKEEMALVLYKNGTDMREYLFIQPFDEVMARWVGGRMSEEEARAVSDVENIREYGELSSFVNSLLNNMRRDASFKCYFDFWHYEADQQETPAHRFAQKLRNDRPSLIMRDLYPILTSMRMIKDEYEITCVRQAIMTTKLGVEQMMKTIRPSMNEMVMEGVFDFVLKQNMCNENAFHTIAASGERATILHYSSNNQPMADGELFLCDLGATFKHYCADISRTFPVNGHFTERQREIYELVLQAQKIVEENARVGVKLKDI